MEYSKDNTMTRKEYLKSKKKCKIDFSKFKYVVIVIAIVLLGVYVFKQLKIYNNVTQIANKVLEESKLAKTMTMYYVSDAYIKDGNSKVVLYKSSDESRTNIPGTDNMSNIYILNNVLYGVIENELYAIDLVTYDKQKVVEDGIKEYTILGSDIIVRMDGGIFKYNLDSKEFKQIIEVKSEQLKADSSNIYVIAKGNSKKSIFKYDLNGENKQELTKDCEVSYICTSDEYVFYVNAKDNKIYMMSKTGEGVQSISDNKVHKNNIIEYKGNIYYVNSSDGNTLYHINLNDSKEEKVVNKNIDSIKIDGCVIYFKLSNSIEIYKYNIETGKYSKVTSARTSEYICKN